MKTLILIILISFISVVSLIFMPYKNTSRLLTKQEIDELYSVFFNAVDYSKVVITTANLPPTMAAYVIGNHIVFREEYYVDDFSKNYLKMARLVHEVGHVWANQTSGIHTLLIAFTEHIRLQDQVYAHNKLSGEKSLDDFRYEQQCRILSDYYINRHLKFDTSKYEKTIYKTINKFY